jgi:diguanylate cyclase (GGDEF)-like protein
VHEEDRETVSPSGDVHLRREVIRAGLWSSAFVSTACAVYLSSTPHGPNRPALWAVLALAVAVTGCILLADRTRRLTRRNRVSLLHLWAATQTAIIATGAALDGGTTSPYVGLLLVPLVAGAIGFPTRDAVGQGLWTMVCLVGAGIASDNLLASHALLWGAGIAAVVGVAAACSRSLVHLSRDLDVANRRLTQVVRIDSLTGCLNHGAFYEELTTALDGRDRCEASLGLLVLDVDHFKRVNDEHGHPVGDEVLRVIGAALRASTRPGDVVGRTGGEEFAVLLPGASGAHASAVGERLRTAIASAGSPVAVTVSVGVATSAMSGGTATELMRLADAALYAAKRSGRDRLVAADDGAPAPLPLAAS